MTVPLALQMMRSNLKILFSLLTFCFKLSYCTIGNNDGISLLCPEIEKEALVNFKQSLEDPSNMLSSWNVSAEANCCNWKGVVCSNITGGGHVHQLRLQSYDQFHGLRGKIDPSLVNLEHLSYLDLSQNDFEETIPSFIGSITSLEYLNLSHAGFYGAIPHTIGNLSNLRVLSLEDGFGSQLSEVCTIEWLSGLSQLEYLNMNHVNLSRASNSLQVISTLPSLVELHFAFCSLDFNNAPLNINITSLAILDLSHNTFRSFDVLKWIFQLSNLIYLDLTANSFEGPILTITNTTKLQHIDLSRNNFNSTIPDWLYSLKDLEFVSLSINIHLQGRLSNDIANLTSLNTLDLSRNQLSGEIPTEIAANLCNMQTLDLSYNYFQGDVSYSFGNVSDCFSQALRNLDLSMNQLSGSLTDQFGELKSLQILHLEGNSLSGSLPTNIGKMSSLRDLFLSDNKLTGNLPESMGQLFNLGFLTIEDNKLEGVVSEIHFANLTQLRSLYASGNHLTLNVSPNWSPPFELEALTLGSWDLGANTPIPIPTWIDQTQKGVIVLDLSNTGLSGNVPSWFWNVRHLNLSHNQLHGNVPDIISDPQAGGFRSLYLSSNQFSGSLPRVPTYMVALDLSDNSFSGGLYHFLCDLTMNVETYTFFLHLGGNQLSGEIPDCWMKWPSLTYLNLGSNMLSGTIPNSISFLADLQSLNLYKNEISGQVPLSMSNCSELVKIDFGENGIEGSIPTWMGTSLPNLEFLILRSNKLSGEISSETCHLNSLQILDLSDNRLSGIVPRCVDNFTAMATKRSLPEILGNGNYVGFFRDSASVATKGSEFRYDTILALVTNIDLSRNNLSGDIPKELTSLVELRSLNLSGNHFTGMIPQTIGDMKQLESLDLSRNSLSGEMPNSFRDMSALNYLNVSYNQLTGKIPESTQLRGFDNSSFIGNDDLCGPPLTSNCITSGGPNMNEEDNHQSDDQYKIEWFYVFTSLGYTVGFSFFCTTLVFNKSWREAYFELLEDMWNRVYVYSNVKWARLKTKAFG